MEGQRPTREQLISLAKSDPEAIADLVLALWDRIEKLEAKVAALELNSRNSSKPPSSDGGNFTNPPKPKSLRTKSGRKPGGQAGHRGETLRQVEHPDHIVEHRFEPSQQCPKCGSGVDAGSGPLPENDCERRQVFELPPIRVEVTEHRVQKCICRGCGTKLVADFPNEVTAPVLYGPNLRATALYLGGYQLIPYNRLPVGACRIIGPTTRQRIQDRYVEITLAGYAINPEPEAPPPGPDGKRKRGRVARGKALNLLDRFDRRYPQIMGFFEFEGVPFDNNQAERDLRMMKVREKISGTFRSEEHAQAFCDLRTRNINGPQAGRGSHRQPPRTGD